MNVPKIPEKFQVFGNAMLVGLGTQGGVYRFSDNDKVVLKVIECAEDIQYQSALHEIEIMERLMSCSGVVHLLDYEVVIDTHIRIHWIDSEEITADNAVEKLGHLDGILVPGGFGSRGIDGMIQAAKYARENDVPYLGICLGMQIAVIEFARNAAGIIDADSGEFNENCENKVIDFMPGQSDEIDKGGTLRLGAYPCDIQPGTMMEKCYETRKISERHRHRYEFNNNYRTPLLNNGLIIGGTSPDGRLVEAIELADSTFYVGVQFHPEFKSRPNRPHPLFKGFVGAAFDRKRGEI